LESWALKSSGRKGVIIFFATLTAGAQLYRLIVARQSAEAYILPIKRHFWRYSATYCYLLTTLDTSLSPAFDVSYAWSPTGEWTSRHQMSINGKREGFKREDLLALAGTAGIKKMRANQILDRVIAAVRRWPDFAAKAGVPDSRVHEIQGNQHTEL
jgi:hypothetical protein